MKDFLLKIICLVLGQSDRVSSYTCYDEWELVKHRHTISLYLNRQYDSRANTWIYFTKSIPRFKYRRLAE